MGDIKELTAPDPEIQILWRERPAPPRKPQRKDYRLLRARITNLVLLGTAMAEAVVIYILQAGPV